jgi:hypothetical protein
MHTNFLSENPMGKDQLVDSSADGMILKWISRTQGVMQTIQLAQIMVL